MRFEQSRADVFLTALRAALSDVDAAAHAGISPETLTRWLRREDFSAAVRRVKAEIAVLNAGRVRQAARDDWRAALALAERAEQQRELERLRSLTTDARS